MDVSDNIQRVKDYLISSHHTSDWIEITQERINRFSQATDDFQWIHVDADRAAIDSPTQTTIAHGYLILSLYPFLRGLVSTEHTAFGEAEYIINYGLNKTRFPAPVMANENIRGHFELIRLEETSSGLHFSEKYTAEISNRSKPACVAEVIMRLIFQ